MKPLIGQEPSKATLSTLSILFLSLYFRFCFLKKHSLPSVFLSSILKDCGSSSKLITGLNWSTACYKDSWIRTHLRVL